MVVRYRAAPDERAHCEVRDRWDRGIADTPFTSMPEPDVFLSADMRELYAQFSDYGKEVVQRYLVSYILKGEVIYKRERFATEKVSTLDSTPEEFLEGLRFWADEWVSGWACHSENLGCGHRARSTAELERR